jgi:glycosyltransferase involved in cell wall biosynthesis
MQDQRHIHSPTAELGRSTARKAAARRVLMLLENAAYPFDSRVRQEAQALLSAGYQVTVIGPARNGQRWHEYVDGVSVYRYPAPHEGSGLVNYLREYIYALFMTFVISLFVWMREGFVAVHAHCPPDMFSLIGLWYKMWGKLYVYDHHDLSPEIWETRSGKRSGVLYNVLRFFEWFSCKLADRVVEPNDSYRAVDRERNRIPDSRIVTVRNGPDPKRVRQVPPDEALVATGRPILGYVGVIGPQDGVDYLLRAMKYLRDDYGRDDVLCVIVGDGEAMPMLRDLTRELKLEDQVLFAGIQTGDKLMAHLCAATICVDPDPPNPLNDVSTMVKVAEYMALGKPVVAFDLKETRATAGEAAVYVPGADERAFAAAVAELLLDPERCERMGRIGVQRVAERLAWHHNAANLVAMYNDILAPAERSVEPVV